MINFSTCSGLYRVWVPLREDGKSTLISIWIDPYLREFKSCSEEKGTNVVPIHRADSATVADSDETNSVFPSGM
jgi:hypothetical protein